jgi:hypothetical protein
VRRTKGSCVVSDVHQHYCRQCRASWEHDGDEILDDAQNKAAHRCPVCGTPGWSKYFGTETHDEMYDLEELIELSQDERIPDHVRQQARVDFDAMARRLHPRPDGRITI